MPVMTVLMEIRDNLSQGLNAVNQQMQRLSQNMQRLNQSNITFTKQANKSAASTLNLEKGINQLVRRLIQLFVIKESIKSFVTFTKAASDAADQILKLSAQTGISVEKIQGIAFSLKLAGIEASEMGNIFKNLQNEIQQAREGSIEAFSNFHKLGISFEELETKGDDAEFMFERVIEALSKIDDSTLRARIGTQLFGRDYVKLSEQIEGGSKALKENTAIARQFGLILSKETLKQADAFGDQMTFLGEVFKVTKIIIAATLSDAIVPFFNKLNEVSLALQAVVLWLDAGWESLKILGRAFIDVAGIAMDRFVVVVDMIGEALGKSLQGKFVEAAAIAKDSLDVMAKGAIEVEKKWSEAWTGVETATIKAENTFKGIVDEQTKFIDKLTESLEKIKQNSLSTSEATAEAVKHTADLKKNTKEVEKNIEIISDEQLRKLVLAREEATELKDQTQKMARVMDNEFNRALTKGIEDYTNGVKTLRQQFAQLFQSLESSLSQFFQDAIEGTKKWEDVFKDFIKNIQKAIMKMVADLLAQEIVRSILGIGGGISIGGARGGGGTTNVGTGISAAQIANQAARAQGTPTTAQGGGGFNFTGLAQGAAFAGGAALFGSATQQKPGKVPSSTKAIGGGAAGGALMGASIGMIFGPWGALIGAGIGAIYGAFMGSKAKKEAEKAKEEMEEQRRQAEEEMERQRREARKLITTHVRTQFGGGLAIEEVSDTVGSLFSGGISDEEIQQFGGAAQVVARRQEIESQAAGQTIVNAPISVNVGTISSSYDVRMLASDLSYLLSNSME